MTGPYDSIIGVEKEAVIHRFLTGMPSRFETAKGDPRFAAAVIDVDPETGRARAIERMLLARTTSAALTYTLAVPPSRRSVNRADALRAARPAGRRASLLPAAGSDEQHRLPRAGGRGRADLRPDGHALPAEGRPRGARSAPRQGAPCKALDAAEWDVLLLDLKLPDVDGVEILATVRRDHPELQTIIVTGFANVQSAIETMRLGAFDYLTKPPNFEELGMRVEKAGEKTLLERENRRLRFQVQRGLSSDILTRSPAMQRILHTIEMVAAARTPVLIEGESGVGKELVAQHVHRLSPRGRQGVRRPQLRRRARVAARERAVRLRARAPSRAPATRSPGWSRWPTAARSSSTRSGR